MSATLDDASNIEAINEYIMNVPLKNKDAATVRDEWLKWHDGLGWYEQSFPSVPTYDRARNIKHKFDLANTTSTEEKAAVKQSHLTGMTSEEMRGEVKRTTSTGNYLDHPEDAEPWIPAKTKIVLAIGGIILTAGLVAKKIYVDPWLKALIPRRS
jgi:hypothetical protein